MRTAALPHTKSRVRPRKLTPAENDWSCIVVPPSVQLAGIRAASIKLQLTLNQPSINLHAMFSGRALFVTGVQCVPAETN